MMRRIDVSTLDRAICECGRAVVEPGGTGVVSALAVLGRPDTIGQILAGSAMVREMASLAAHQLCAARRWLIQGEDVSPVVCAAVETLKRAMVAP